MVKLGNGRSNFLVKNGLPSRLLLPKRKDLLKNVRPRYVFLYLYEYLKMMSLQRRHCESLTPERRIKI